MNKKLTSAVMGLTLGLVFKNAFKVMTKIK